MERTFSVDDLVGGIWRLNQAGMGRTDSEAAFQEFLKRIPSATNLAAAANASGSCGALNMLESSQLQLQMANGLDSNGAPGSSMPPLSEGLNLSSSHLGNMPRVPSLVLLKQLMMQNQMGSSSQACTTSAPAPPPVSLPIQPVKAEQASSGTGSGSTGPPPPLSSAMPAVDQAALQAAGLALSANPLLAGITPSVAAAAALQLGQLSSLRLAGSGNSSDPVMHEKLELRRQRRMLSNRESARRSRRRKQEHLHVLEKQIDELADVKKEVSEKADVLARRYREADEDNKRLKEENERLKEELRFLRNQLSDRKGERNGAYHHGGNAGSRREYEEDEQQAVPRPAQKRQRAARASTGDGAKASSHLELKPDLAQAAGV